MRHSKQSEILAEPQFHYQHHARQQHGDAIGNNDRPRDQQDAVHQPQRDPQSEEAVHAQRNIGGMFGAPHLPDLRHEGDSGKRGGDCAYGIAKSYVHFL
jgi:hypothetical protein